jgi:hypothetical protein
MSDVFLAETSQNMRYFKAKTRRRYVKRGIIHKNMVAEYDILVSATIKKLARGNGTGPAGATIQTMIIKQKQ